MKKHLIYLIITAFSLMFCFPMQASYLVDEQSGNTRLVHTGDKLRPRSVSACIFCYYYNGELSLDSYEDITDFTVSIVDESNGQTAVFYLSGVEDTIDITLSTGSYRIELRTFDGQLYEGTLTISE